jgi:hypothetical protein
VQMAPGGRETIVGHRKGKFDAVRHVGHHFILALFATLNSTASESLRGRCVDVVQFRFQESLGDDQRADVAVARRNHLVGSCVQRIRFLERLWIGQKCSNSVLTSGGACSYFVLMSNSFKWRR